MVDIVISLNIYLSSLATFTLIHSWFGCVYANSLFTRDERLDNRRASDASSDLMTSIPLDQCARHCHSASTCLSFSYDQDGGRCQLMSRIYINPELTNAESVIFRKRNENGICEIPTSIAKGKLLFINGQMEGSKAEFVCDDFYIPTIEVGVCDPSGAWAGLDNPCQEMSSPYTVPAVGKIYAGSCFIVIATPTDNTHFRLYLLEKFVDKNILIDVRFTTRGNRIIIRNTRTGDNWGSEERDTSYWPFIVNQEFNMTICAEETMYKVFVDGADIFTYAYRRSISGITKLGLDADVSLRKIQFGI